MAEPDPGSSAGVALAAEFPPVDRAAWEALAGELDRLRTTTYDGLTVEPLYTAEDGSATSRPTRLRTVRPRSHGGGHSHRLGRASDRRPPRRTPGRRWSSNAVRRPCCSTCERPTASTPTCSPACSRASARPRTRRHRRRTSLGGWRHRARGALGAPRARPEDVSGSLGADPFGALASGRSTVDIDGAVRRRRRVGAAHGRERTRRCGRSSSTARGSTTPAPRTPRSSAWRSPAPWRPFDAHGRRGARRRRRVRADRVPLAATADQFATIAKFRAARRLWARVAEIAGDAEAAGRSPIHAVSSSAMMTRYDPCREHAAGHRGVLRRRRRRRRRRSPCCRTTSYSAPRLVRARPAHRPQHPVGARDGVAPRRRHRPGRRVVVRRAAHDRSGRSGLGRRSRTSSRRAGSAPRSRPVSSTSAIAAVSDRRQT